MIILILIIVIGGGMYAYKELMPPIEQETAEIVYATKEVERGDISVGVEVMGGLDPSNHGGLRVPGDRTSGAQYVIEQYLVEEGDEVKSNQTVAELSSNDIESQLEQKQEELENKRRQLAEVCQVSEDEVDTVNPSNGITITAPIDGVVTEMAVDDGQEIELGNMIARIVDNSKYIVEATLFEGEIEKIKEGQKVKLSFDYFDGYSDGIVTDINYNPIPYNKDDYAYAFVHKVKIEAENIGLVEREMEVRVGVESKRENGDNIIYNFTLPGEVDRFIKEEKVMNTSVEAVITDVHVEDMQKVKKGDPIITMSGLEVQDVIQEKIDEIWDLKNEISKLSKNVEQMEIKAPMDGIVAGFHREVGEMVGPGEWIGSLYTVSDMRMWTEVDDIDILNVQQGAPVKITVDAIPDKAFEGVVENVSTMGEQKNGISIFGVEIKVTGSSELRPGMQAKAYIDAGSSENVLLIPVEAIFEEDGKTMVEVLQDNTAKVVTVELGLMNNRVAEVKSGLEEGDLVITGSSADLLPSQHIKSNEGILPDSGEDDGKESGEE